MNAGKYKKKILICCHSENETENEAGKTLQGLKVIKSVKASIKPTVSKESYELSRLTNTISYDIRIRYNKDLESTDNIIIYKGERYEITSAVNVREENKELSFTAVKIRKAGVSRAPIFEI